MTERIEIPTQPIAAPAPDIFAVLCRPAGGTSRSIQPGCSKTPTVIRYRAAGDSFVGSHGP